MLKEKAGIILRTRVIIYERTRWHMTEDSILQEISDFLSNTDQPGVVLN